MEGPSSRQPLLPQPMPTIKQTPLVQLSLLTEHIIGISLFGAFPPRKTRFFDIVTFTPFPHSTELLSQVYALGIVEGVSGSWAYRVPASWMMTKQHEDDVALLPAIEYMIPRATLSLFTLVSWILSVGAAPVGRLHLALWWDGLQCVNFRFRNGV